MDTPILIGSDLNNLSLINHRDFHVKKYAVKRSKKMKKIIFTVFFISISCSYSGAMIGDIVEQNYEDGDFKLVYNNVPAGIFIDANDYKVVEIAVNLLAVDIENVTDVKPAVRADSERLGDNVVIAGTIGHNKLVDKLIKVGKINSAGIAGQWESYALQVIEKPFANVDTALVILGSDRRGTAYGIFELSKQIGVSPWYWWADVPVAKKKNLIIKKGYYRDGPPSVKYRGIFINDEDFGLKPWAAKTYDPELGDIGPKTYRKVFELLLRLKANHCWPAMHSCTKPFNFYPDNKKVADDYAIVMGSAHCEPLLYNNASEWDTATMGDWRYDTNRDTIYKVLDKRVSENGRYENVYTVGLRGIHDSGMRGNLRLEDQIALLEQVFTDQRKILTTYIDKPITDIPQVFIPYKEVMTLYDNGLKVPDDVTLMWVDDNHGYIRRLSDPREQKRSGGSGVYYHLSYWGFPEDFLWLGSNSPAITAYEMYKAYAYGANRVWIFNVGDIKPIEKETTFALEMAWDIDRWSPWNAQEFNTEWAGRVFGPEFADEIGDILNIYYRLAADGRPEHILNVEFSDSQIDKRLNEYRQITERAEKLRGEIPEELRDAYFQLIYYPVVCAKLINEKIFYIRRSLSPAGNNDSRNIELAKKALEAFDGIVETTRIYNEDIAGGKWLNMMYYRPNNRLVFQEPERIASNRTAKFPRSAAPEPVVSIPAKLFSKKKDYPEMQLRVIPGYKDGAVTIENFTAAPIADGRIENAPWVEYEASLDAGDYEVTVRCMPTHRIHEGRGVRIAIAADGNNPVIQDLHAAEWTDQWSANVLRGYSVGQAALSRESSGKTTVRVYLTEPGVVLDKISIYKK